MKNLILLTSFLLLSTLSFGQYSRKVDKFKDEVICTYNTTSISFNKYIGSDTMYQTVFTIYDTYLTASGSNAILLFSDKSKIELSGDVDVDYSSPGYYRYTFYSYDKEIVEQLSKKHLVGFKLHIFEKNLSSQSKIAIKIGATKILSSK